MNNAYNVSLSDLAGEDVTARTAAAMEESLRLNLSESQVEVNFSGSNNTVPQRVPILGTGSL